jgi:DNA invertase Pin-like site-specific DNA recombinase
MSSVRYAALVGYIARKNREDIIRRTTAGRERSRANDVKFGKLTPVERQQVSARRAAGESQNTVALVYNVSCSTISRLEHSREGRLCAQSRTHNLTR